MRIRTIKPEFWADEKIGALSHGARLLFLASLNLADDEGILRWNANFLVSNAFTYDDVRLETIGKWMKELLDLDLVRTYEHHGSIKQVLGWIVNFRKHQVINRPQPSKFSLPPFEDFVPICSYESQRVINSVNDSVNKSLNESRTYSHPEKEGKGMEEDKEMKGNRKEKNNTLLSEVEPSDVPDDEKKYYEITLKFWELFKKNLTDLKIHSTDLEKAKYKNWVDPIRLMMERDKRSKEEMIEIYNFLTNEKYNLRFMWKSVIRSTENLREKFEKLLVESRKQNMNTSGAVGNAFDDARRQILNA